MLNRNRHSLLLAIVFGILIFTGIHYINKTYYRLQTEHKENYDNNKSSKQLLTKNEHNSSSSIEEVLKKSRAEIRTELSKYNALSYFGDHNNSLEDLFMESGGRPIRTVIVSNWRSGSTFFGELLSTIPGSFYHNEPILPLIRLGTMNRVDVRGPPNSNQAINALKNIFKCNFSLMENYFERARANTYFMDHFKTLLHHCSHDDIDMCYTNYFTSQFCKLFPFQIAKLCHLRLRFVQELLHDEELDNMKVILYMRDPRAVLNSRWRDFPCEAKFADCWPEQLCADMIRDYKTASDLLPLYPDRLMVLRFEELALDPYLTTHRVLKFLKLDAAKVTLDEYLKSHTNVRVSGIRSTFRVSREIPYSWKHELDFDYVADVQVVCEKAMRLWGYRRADNATHMASKEFNPVMGYHIGT